MNRKCDLQKRHVECAAYFVPVLLSGHYFPMFANNHEFCLQIYPGAFQNPKATSSTLSIQVLPGSSLKVQSNVMFPCLFPITGWLGPETILGRCWWCDAGQLKRIKRRLNHQLSLLHTIEQTYHPVEVLMERFTFARSWVRDQRQKFYSIRDKKSAKYSFQTSRCLRP